MSQPRGGLPPAASCLHTVTRATVGAGRKRSPRRGSRPPRAGEGARLGPPHAAPQPNPDTLGLWAPVRHRVHPLPKTTRQRPSSRPRAPPLPPHPGWLSQTPTRSRGRGWVGVPTGGLCWDGMGCPTQPGGPGPDSASRAPPTSSPEKWGWWAQNPVTGQAGAARWHEWCPSPILVAVTPEPAPGRERGRRLHGRACLPPALGTSS